MPPAMVRELINEHVADLHRQARNAQAIQAIRQARRAQDELLRTAARDRLAAPAGQAGPSRPQHPVVASARRLAVMRPRRLFS